MKNCAFHNPTKIYFGKGQLAKLDEAAPRDGVILTLYGGGSIKRNGVYDQVRQALIFDIHKPGFIGNRRGFHGRERRVHE